VEDAPSVEYIARFIARLQQKYTQRGGRRPFGISTLIAGFDVDGSPHLYQTDPSGTYSEWISNAIGRNDKTVREFLEKRHDEKEVGKDGEVKLTEDGCIRLAVQALLEVVESGSKNVEVAVMRRDVGLTFCAQEYIDKLTQELNDEKEKKKAQTAGSQSSDW